MRKPYTPRKRERKSDISPAEIKSSCGQNVINNNAIWGDALLGYGCGNKYGWSWLSAYAAWTYYMSVSAVGNATDLIMENFASSVKPVIKDTQTGELIKEVNSRIPETQILELFKNPNTDQTMTELMEGQGKCFDVTGNMYTVISAITEDSEPRYIKYVNPSAVTAVEDGMGGVSSYMVTDGGSVTTYYRLESNDKTQYFTKDMTQELNHMKRFNPRSSSGSTKSTVGMSPYNAVFFEIEQFLAASTHNFATLDQGASPSAAVTIDKDAKLTDEQIERLQKQVRDKIQGAENAGNIMFLEGGKDIKMLSMSNKDMEFLEGIKLDKEQIYKNKNIPLEFLSGNAKYSNLQESKAQLFDMAIFPFAKRYFEEMTRFIMPRYDKKNSGRYVLAFDPRDVPAMEYAMIEKAKLESETNAVNTNEVRETLGREPLDNGDDVLIDSRKTTLDNIISGTQLPEPTPVQEKSMTREYFVELMKKQTNGGVRKHSDVEIVKMSNEMTFLT
ncbi:MAG: hypothetical protein DRH97_00265 [Chloroflexi bacterium]|nr:MAG: hypothetical protein DRH97_00265 [Chloroflexota bacterium]